MGILGGRDSVWYSDDRSPGDEVGHIKELLCKEDHQLRNVLQQD
jgi:hypothetical protein